MSDRALLTRLLTAMIGQNAGPALPTPIPNYVPGSVTGQPIPNASPGDAQMQPAAASPWSAATQPQTPAYQLPFTGLKNTAGGSAPYMYNAPSSGSPSGWMGENAVSPTAMPSPQGNYGPVWGGGAAPSAGGPMLPAPPAQWMGLNNQNRTAAYDPLRDYMDPNNRHLVDAQYGLTPKDLLGL